MREEYYETLMGGVIPTGLPGGFFIYEAGGDEKVIFAETNIVKLFGCDTYEEFLEFIGGTFKGMIHPDDLLKIENQIEAQTIYAEKRHDYVRYRIVTKQGEIRYVEDFGHLLHWANGKSFYYVFIVDVDQNEYLNTSRNSYAEAEALASNRETDELTGLFNMSFFYNKVQILLGQPDIRRQDVSFVHFDIPNFKLYKERHGFKIMLLTDIGVVGLSRNKVRRIHLHRAKISLVGCFNAEFPARLPVMDRNGDYTSNLYKVVDQFLIVHSAPSLPEFQQYILYIIA